MSTEATATGDNETKETDDSFARSFNAQDWAKAFVERARKDPAFATDEGNMIGWFANAIMRGFDEHAWRTPEQALRSYAEITNHINRYNGWNVLTPEAWDDPHRIPAVLALIHSEVSEALEAFRHNDRANFAEELADVLIRVLDATGGLGIDIDAEVLNKLAKNRERGYKHGGKRI